jgi:hypothetical protein
MAANRADKAPERTVEGLRRVGVILYDTDPDQLACIACGQQWQVTSLPLPLVALPQRLQQIGRRRTGERPRPW